MALLDSFVSFLSEEELRHFRSIPLSGKEKKIRDLLAENRNGEFSKVELMKELHLSSSHFDKISTLVLKKAYKHLAGQDDLEQLNFLSKKFMFRHLFHEIKTLKTKISRNNTDEVMAERYHRAFFDFSINVPAKYFDEGFVMDNANEYLKWVRKDKQARELEVKSKLLFARLNVITQKAPDAGEAAKIEREIDDLEKSYEAVDVPEFKAILYHVRVNFYRMIHPDWKKRTYFLKKITRLYGGEEKMPLFERAVASLHQAEMMFERSEYQAAFDLYSTTLTHYMPLLRNQFHHFARWIELAMILRQYQSAKQFLDSHFKIYVVNHHESNGVLGSLLYAEYYLLNGEYELAFQHISLAKSLNSIQVYFNYEIKLRMLETLFFAFSKDYEFVSRLSQRNIRYIQLQKLSLKKYRYAHFFYLVKDFRSVRRHYPNHLTPKISSYLSEFANGYEALTGILLHRLFSAE